MDICLKYFKKIFDQDPDADGSQTLIRSFLFISDKIFIEISSLAFSREVANRQTDRQTARQTDRQTAIQTDRQTHKQTDRQTNGQTDRQTHKQTKSG